MPYVSDLLPRCLQLLPPQSDGHDDAPIDLISVNMSSHGVATRRHLAPSQLDNHAVPTIATDEVPAANNHDPLSTTRSDATASYGDLLGAAPSYNVRLPSCQQTPVLAPTTGRLVATRASHHTPSPCSSTTTHTRCRRCQHATRYAGDGWTQRLTHPHPPAHQSNDLGSNVVAAFHGVADTSRCRCPIR